MGTVGDAYDNAMAESFLPRSSAKLLNRRCFKTRRKRRWRSLIGWKAGTTLIGAIRRWVIALRSTTSAGRSA